MPKKFVTSVVKKVINEKTFLCVKLGKNISNKELKVLKVYLSDCLKTFSFEEEQELEA